jgi:hypothetical protein
MSNSDEQQQNGNILRILSYRQKWIAGVGAPIVVLLISWAGSWVSSMVTQGAVQDTRLAVIENRVTVLESQRREFLETVREIREDVRQVKEKLDYITFESHSPEVLQRMARIERKLDQMTAKERHVGPVMPIPDSVRACKEDEYQVRAANGEYFCRRR